MSPIFAAIVLGSILSKIEEEFHAQGCHQLRSNTPLDDKKDGLPIIMVYIGDVNCLLPLEDVKFFLKKFNEYGWKFGAIVKSEKTRILTSTASDSIMDLLQYDNKTELSLIADYLPSAINRYSRVKDQDGSTPPLKEVDGLQS